MIVTRLGVRRVRNRREAAGGKEFVGYRRMPGGREIRLTVTKRRSEAVQRTIARATQGGGGGSTATTGGSSSGGYTPPSGGTGANPRDPKQPILV